MGTLGEAGTSQIDRLMHSANNCHQMLQAIDRKLARALRCIEEGRAEDCRRLLAELTEALPQAMAIIQHDNDDEMKQDSNCG